jgi:hypothetical protein
MGQHQRHILPPFPQLAVKLKAKDNSNLGTTATYLRVKPMHRKLRRPMGPVT